MKPRKSSRLQSTRKKKKNKQEPLYGRNKGAENRALFLTPKLDELKMQPNNEAWSLRHTRTNLLNSSISKAFRLLLAARVMLFVREINEAI